MNKEPPAPQPHLWDGTPMAAMPYVISKSTGTPDQRDCQSTKRATMIDEQKLRELAEAATPGPWISAGPSFGAEFPVYCNEVIVNRDGDEDDGYGICQAPTCLEQESTHDMDYIAAVDPQTSLALLDELATLRQERTAWRVTAENAEKDAARYRWLLANYARGDGYDAIDQALNDGEPDTQLSPAIDAAIAAATKETP